MEESIFSHLCTCKLLSFSMEKLLTANPRPDENDIRTNHKRRDTIYPLAGHTSLHGEDMHESSASQAFEVVHGKWQGCVAIG